MREYTAGCTQRADGKIDALAVSRPSDVTEIHAVHGKFNENCHKILQSQSTGCPRTQSSETQPEPPGSREAASFFQTYSMGNVWPVTHRRHRYHRNGISGVPFHVVLFEEPSEDDARVRVRS